MASTEINVDPKLLRQDAQEMQKIYTKYRSNLEQVAAENQRLKEFWTGAAATAYLTSFSAIKANCDNYMQTLNATITALYEAADNYEQSEKAIKAEADNMPKLPGNTMR